MTHVLNTQEEVAAALVVQFVGSAIFLSFTKAFIRLQGGYIPVSFGMPLTQAAKYAFITIQTLITLLVQFFEFGLSDTSFLDVCTLSTLSYACAFLAYTFLDSLIDSCVAFSRSNTPPFTRLPSVHTAPHYPLSYKEFGIMPMDMYAIQGALKAHTPILAHHSLKGNIKDLITRLFSEDFPTKALEKEAIHSLVAEYLPSQQPSNITSDKNTENSTPLTPELLESTLFIIKELVKNPSSTPWIGKHHTKQNLRLLFTMVIFQEILNDDGTGYLSSQAIQETVQTQNTQYQKFIERARASLQKQQHNNTSRTDPPLAEIIISRS